MPTVGRIIAFLYVDILAMYTMFAMNDYLTNVWKIGFTHASAIFSIFWGLVLTLPLCLKFIADSVTGSYRMHLISNIAYCAGLGSLMMSTPPVLADATGTCSDYEPECIGHVQKILFYAGVSLVALGFSCHLISWSLFIFELLIGEEDRIKTVVFREWRYIFAGFVIATVSLIPLPCIKPWSIRFGFPAICSLVATLLAFSDSSSNRYSRPIGSQMTMFFRVLVAATFKLFYRIPRDAKELYESKHPLIYKVPHTRSLRCLDKAAVVIPEKPLEEQVKNRWRLCRVTDVEETKIIIRMIPVWMTFILCVVLSTTGYTYFVEQSGHLDQKVGLLKVPHFVLMWFYTLAHSKFAQWYAGFANLLGQSGLRKFAPPIGIVVSMILAILCYITAAKVENRRLGVVQKHGLADKPDEMVPMTMFWLLPQILLLGALDGVFYRSATSFFADEFPIAKRSYLPYFIAAVFGMGIFGSVLSVFVVGKVSERGGEKNWFQHNLNQSRLDKYYWTLAWLMAINIVIFIAVSILYWYTKSDLGDQEAGESGEMEEPFEDDATCCC